MKLFFFSPFYAAALLFADANIFYLINKRLVDSGAMDRVYPYESMFYVVLVLFILKRGLATDDNKENPTERDVYALIAKSAMWRVILVIELFILGWIF